MFVAIHLTTVCYLVASYCWCLWPLAIHLTTVQSQYDCRLSSWPHTNNCVTSAQLPSCSHLRSLGGSRGIFLEVVNTNLLIIYPPTRNLQKFCLKMQKNKMDSEALAKNILIFIKCRHHQALSTVQKTTWLEVKDIRSLRDQEIGLTLLDIRYFLVDLTWVEQQKTNRRPTEDQQKTNRRRPTEEDQQKNTIRRRPTDDLQMINRRL